MFFVFINQYLFHILGYSNENNAYWSRQWKNDIIIVRVHCAIMFVHNGNVANVPIDGSRVNADTKTKAENKKPKPGVAY